MGNSKLKGREDTGYKIWQIYDNILSYIRQKYDNIYQKKYNEMAILFIGVYSLMVDSRSFLTLFQKISIEREGGRTGGKEGWSREPQQLFKNQLSLWYDNYYYDPCQW